MVPKKNLSKRVSCGHRYKVQKLAKERQRKARKEAKRNPIAAATARSKLKRDPGIPNLFPFKEKLLGAAMIERQRAEEERKLRRQQAQQKDGSMAVDHVSDIEQYAKLAKKRGEAFDAATTSIHSSKKLQEIFLRKAKTSAGDDANLYGRVEASGSDDNNSDGDMEVGSEDEESDEDVPEAIPLDSTEYRDVLEAVSSGRKDNSRKAYYKEFKNVVSKADVILEVLDCRDPLGCRARDIEELILNAGGQKKIVLLLNKIDLVPRDVVLQWVKFLKNEYPTVAFKASTQNQRHNLGQKSGDITKMSAKDLSGSESVGADELIQLLKNYCRSEGMKTSITVGVIGYPNVGKSSVINSLKRSKVCQVGSTPGITKTSQVIHLDKNLKLLDSPGIVFSNGTGDEDAAEILLRNCIKVELVDDPITPVNAVVKKTSQEKLVKLYKIHPFTDATDMLIQIARTTGRLKKGGIPDVEATARLVLQDWNSGKIPYHASVPRTHSAHVGATLLSPEEAAAAEASSTHLAR